jgi:hypothetical protein
MKPWTIPLVAALGFTGIGQANAAVEAFTVPMNGYVIVAFVGATPAEVAQAQRLAKRWEAQRHLMLKPQSMKAVFIRQSPTDALTQAELRSAAIAAARAHMP